MLAGTCTVVLYRLKFSSLRPSSSLLFLSVLGSVPSSQTKSMHLLFPTMPEDGNVDIERCMTASVKQSHGCQPSLEPKTGRDCAIAVQHLDGKAVLINTTIKEEVDRGLILSSAKKQIFGTLTRTWYQGLVGKLLLGLVVGTARVNQVHQFFSTKQFESFFWLTFPPSRSYTADHNHILPDIKDPVHRHLESIFKTSPSTPCSQKHSITLNSSYAQQLTLLRSTISARYQQLPTRLSAPNRHGSATILTATLPAPALNTEAKRSSSSDGSSIELRSPGC